ncbi:alkaline phosphatase family protein [Prolixibacteraceae bacterium JC049]|nr:alkaline phosphatase family protein [Prolixibacteraceae bacterium JC049]
MLKAFLVCCGVMLSIGAIAQKNERPKLVVGVVIEQMRPEYLTRFESKYRNGGFKRLMNKGAQFSNARIDQLIQNQASGMATLFTGTTPSIHGIVDNEWYDRLKEKTVNAADDDYYITVGSDSKQGNSSAAQVMVETIGDRLKLESGGKSKVFSVALNGHSAIFSAGHAADGAYWFDIETGNMISSSYYISEFPNWVRDFNAKNMAADYLSRDWDLLLPKSSYEESLPDDYLLEEGFYGKWNTFPYDLKKIQKRANNLKPLKATPFGNTMIKDFSVQLLDEEQLGQDNITDFLTVTFSSMDYENNSFGPLSVEMEDIYLRLDKEIEHLFRVLDSKVGEGNYVLFLTSNMSSSYSPDYLKEELRLPVGKFSPKSAIALLKSYLNITFGQGEWIISNSEYQIYFNHKLIEKKEVDIAKMQRLAATFLNQFKGVKMAVPATTLHHGNGNNSILSPFAHSYNYKRSGDLFYSLEQGWWPVFKYKRTEYTDSKHVPLILYGANIKKGKFNEPVNLRSLVPTICQCIGLTTPEHATEKPLNVNW